MSKKRNSKLKNILIECKNTIDQRLVSSSKIAYLHKELREIEADLNTDWYKYFKEETSSINEILKLAQNISNADVSKIRFNINSAESWNDNHDIKKIEIFTKSLSEAKDLINKLELNEDILIFLRKMVMSTATVTDLTDDVLHWLKKENLEKRVKLSF